MTGLRKLLLINALAVDRLPKAYKKADYLKITGQCAHIDTGIGNEQGLKIEFTFLTETYALYASIIGNFVSGSKGWRVILGSTARLIVNAYSGAYSQLFPSGGTIMNNKTTVTFDTQKSIATNNTGTVEIPAAEITGNDREANIALGRNLVSRGAGSSGESVIRLYGCKIWDDGALVREYVPCVRKSDSKPGFYDKVNNTFNPSIGSAEFVAGNDA